MRALATDGIQRGHMALHARSVALAAGAAGDQVERVAAMIVEARDITLEGAKRALGVLAAESGEARHGARHAGMSAAAPESLRCILDAVRRCRHR